MNPPKDVQDMSAVFNYMKRNGSKVITLKSLVKALPHINYKLTATHVHKKSMQRLVLTGDRIMFADSDVQSTLTPVVKTSIPNLEDELCSSELINDESNMNSCYDTIQSIAFIRTASYASMHLGFRKSDSDSKLPELELISICLDNPERVTYVIDVKEVKTKKLLAVLQLVLKNFTVIFYDGRKASDYLSKRYNLQIGKAISVKLLFECVTGEAMATFEQIV
ncbi:hypothetical protein HDV02_004964 [Globomyces sp. JEL0801]|nr:hypothetical protein HDV02_004964 [Globomyces sp. JEL0801]